MSERDSSGITVRGGKWMARGAVGRWIIGLGMIAALVLAAAAPGRAQGQSPAQASTPKSAGQSAAKGQHEGITVHGHWTIEVRNPDGKVVSHSEFENSISPGFPFPLGGGAPTQVPGGEAFLSAVLTDQIAEPVPWTVLLVGPNGLSNDTDAPCVSTSIIAVDATDTGVGACFLFENGLPSGYVAYACNTVPTPPADSCNLTATPLGTPPNFTGFQLSGSVVATQAGTVYSVATLDMAACGQTQTTFPNCPFLNANAFASFTSKTLDGNSVPGDPVSVPVIAGQTIAVTVTITFQ